MAMARSVRNVLALRPASMLKPSCVSANISRPFLSRLKKQDDEWDGWAYRKQNPIPPSNSYPGMLGMFCMTYIWWWIWWHVFTEPEHMLSTNFEHPDPREWTDEELGIPPDDE